MSKFPYIIAEVASAHEGDSSNLEKIVDNVINAKSDAIKFQIFKTNELLVKNHPMYSEFSQIFMKFEIWKKICKKIQHNGVEVIIEPFDNESLNFAKEDMEITNFKIPATNIADLDLIEKTAKDSDKVFLGVGGSTEIEIINAIEIIKKTNNKLLILVCGVQSFPTRLEDIKLSQIKYLKDKFDLDICFADHVNAENKEMAKLTPILAHSLGANYIEKHVTLDRSIKGKDYYSSMNPDEFTELVNLLRKVHVLYGQTSNWTLSDADLNYRKFSKKFAVAKKKIIKGTSLSDGSFVFKRTNDLGITLQEFQKLKGKKINKDLELDESLKIEFLE